MGGFGALNLAMLHPDVFGAVYALSPGLFDANGLANSQMFISPAGIQTLLGIKEKLEALPKAEAQKQLANLARTAGANQMFALAYGAAFAPDPESNLLLKYPYTVQDGKLVQDDVVWKQWEAGFGNWAEKVQTYKDNLLALRAIGFDCGKNDEFKWITEGCVYVDQQMTDAGIPHQCELFEGGHQDKLGERVEKVILPFFFKNLAKGE